MRQSNFQFLNPYLEKIYFKTNDNFDIDNDEYEIKNAFNIEIKRSKTDNLAKVSLTLDINNENDEDAPFTLNIKVTSDFKWLDMPEEMVEIMLKCNAPSLLLSYMRPIVANITNSSNYPVYNLPFINFKE